MINGLEGPGSLLLDVSFRYQVPLNEGIDSLDLFYDIFNLLNRTNYVPPSGNRASADVHDSDRGAVPAADAVWNPRAILTEAQVTKYKFKGGHRDEDIHAQCGVSRSQLGVVAFAQMNQEKGGGDETGPYNLVAGLAAKLLRRRPCDRIDGRHLGRKPRSRLHLQPRLPAGAQGRTRRRRQLHPGAQRVRVRHVAEGSGAPSALGSRLQRRRSQRQADRVVGAAQQAVRAAASHPREPVRSRSARLARGRWRACDLQVHARRQEAGDDARHADAVGQRRRRTSRGRPTSRGCRTARSSSATATSTLASSSSTRTESSS